ncbi:MAG: LysR family transcriptional regulator [Cyclobacteriaceae bacterium]|nr:LysR family transcriptional regulator [Cyclobacteriaceae bacterium]
MIEIRHLRLIREIVEAGNLTLAAKRLHLTQPSLSHQLQEIETRLGVQLFLRINKKMRITPAGQRMLRAAETILPQMGMVEKEIRENGTAKEIRVSTHCYTCYHWLPALMKDFRRQFPDVQIEIVTEAMKEPVQYLLAGKIDIALTSIRSAERGLHFEKLFDDEQVLLLRNDHPLASREYVTARDLSSECLITYTEPFERGYFASRVLIPAGVTPAKITQMQLTEARVELVKAGMGITVLSKWLAKPFLGNGRELSQLRISRSGFFRPWYLVMLKQKMTDKGLRAFTEHLREYQLGMKLP